MQMQSDRTEEVFQRRLFRLCRCPDARREYDHWHGDGAAAEWLRDRDAGHYDFAEVLA